MPTTDPMQGISTPLYTDPYTIPADLLAIIAALLSRSIPRFTTTGDRDTKIPTPVDGQHAWANGVEYVYRDSGWQPVVVTVSRFVRSSGSDANVTTGADTNLVSGTITGARPGMWRINGRASLYTSGSSCVGHLYVQWASGGGAASQERARWDMPNSGGTYPQSPAVERVIEHTGGDLAIDCGYGRSGGGYWVTGNPSGLTVVEATYLGPAL